MMTLENVAIFWFVCGFLAVALFMIPHCFFWPDADDSKIVLMIANILFLFSGPAGVIAGALAFWVSYKEYQECKRL